VFCDNREEYKLKRQDNALIISIYVYAISRTTYK